MQNKALKIFLVAQKISKINNFHFSFLSLIYFCDSQESDWRAILYIWQEITPTCFERRQDIAVRLKFFILVLSKYDRNLELLAKTAKQRKAPQIGFSRTQQKGASRFWTETITMTAVLVIRSRWRHEVKFWFYFDL